MPSRRQSPGLLLQETREHWSLMNYYERFEHVVAFILSVTDPFVEPFRGMFQLDRVGSDAGSVLDVAAIVALVGWTLIEALVLALLSLGARRGEDATV